MFFEDNIEEFQDAKDPYQSPPDSQLHQHHHLHLVQVKTTLPKECHKGCETSNLYDDTEPDKMMQDYTLLSAYKIWTSHLWESYNWKHMESKNEEIKAIHKNDT